MTRSPHFALAPVALVLAAAALLSACPAAPAAAAVAGAEPLVLKAYDVPAEQAAEFQGIIQGLLSVGKDQPRRGTAALTPSGQLLVSAPAGFQPGIAEAIAKLSSSPAVRAPTVTLDYWIVAGARAAEGTPGKDVAPEVAGVIDAIEKSQGPMKLALLERLTLSSQSGSSGSVEGSLAYASQTASLHGDKVVAQIDVRGTRMKGALNARVEIPVGKSLVLGQAGVMLGGASSVALSDEALAQAGDKGTLTAFYIVRATVDGE